MYQRHIPFILQDAGQAHLFWEILPQFPAHRAFFLFNFYNSLLSDPFVRQLSNIRIVIYILCFLHQQAMHYETSLFHNKLLSSSYFLLSCTWLMWYCQVWPWHLFLQPHFIALWLSFVELYPEWPSFRSLNVLCSFLPHIFYIHYSLC